MTDEQLRLAYARQLAAAARSAPCPPPDALLALVEKHGTEAERLATLDHAMSCDACHRDLEMLRSVSMAGAQLDDRASVARRWLTRANRPWMIAAAAGLVILVGGVATFTQIDGPRVFRGAALAPVMVTPTSLATVAPSPVQFVWRSAPTAVAYELEVLRATGDSVFTIETTDTTMTLPLQITLSSDAEYLWLVRARFADGSQAASAPARFRIQP